MTEPNLTVGYSTLATRAGAIELPPARADIEILIVVQDAPPGFDLGVADRSDVRVVLDDGIGVARSRNVVLDEAQGRYVLFGDDDATWLVDGIDELMGHLDRSPRTSIVQGRVADESGRLRKRYPDRVTRLHRWNSAKAGTIELMVRRSDIVEHRVRFDEGFGAGAVNHLGDEYIFIADALRAGLRGEFVPVTVAVHAAESSGLVGGTVEDARSRSAVFERVFGRLAPMPRLLFLLRRPKRFGSVALGCRFVLGGRAIERAAEEPG